MPQALVLRHSLGAHLAPAKVPTEPPICLPATDLGSQTQPRCLSWFRQCAHVGSPRTQLGVHAQASFTMGQTVFTSLSDFPAACTTLRASRRIPSRRTPNTLTRRIPSLPRRIPSLTRRIPSLCAEYPHFSVQIARHWRRIPSVFRRIPSPPAGYTHLS